MKIQGLPFAAALLACAFSFAPGAQASELRASPGLKTSAGLKVQRGGASWYGPGFHGRRTANGETFNTNAMTAAHRSLPFGTRVKVVNRRTGKSVVVRINDRGPFHKGRIIDLAKAPAQVIGMSGTADVEVHALN